MAKTIITLSREYCTGGRFIAQDVADALGVNLENVAYHVRVLRDFGMIALERRRPARASP